MVRTKKFDEDAVLDKAVDLFRRQGYQGTTPRELTEQLGISRSSLYDTYGDKRSLFIKVMKRYKRNRANQLKSVQQRSVNALQSIRTIFQMTVDECFVDADPKGCFLVNAIIELAPRETELINLVSDCMKDHEDVLYQLIRQGIADRQIKRIAHPKAAARYLVNALYGISISVKAGADRKLCSEIIRNTLSPIEP
ncbi:TetR/AcrR family transcriptional regulator [Chitinophaga horti]|uniref:TetR/AcrR family transcriptional regulator n=1 Tax=Chitinophaga horti TaxID=2920382 RepID=A0ABY6J4W5_9BACT|nr:TetR/AcrR family transcriptional regulator [Chitinophaga horti]UYQ94662.1 TetR/AcrR family transcriptional regulator [Chitinophaga horti]